MAVSTVCGVQITRNTRQEKGAQQAVILPLTVSLCLSTQFSMTECSKCHHIRRVTHVSQENWSPAAQQPVSNCSWSREHTHPRSSVTSHLRKMRACFTPVGGALQVHWSNLLEAASTQDVLHQIASSCLELRCNFYPVVIRIKQLLL